MEAYRKIHAVIDDHLKDTRRAAEDEGMSILKHLVQLLLNGHLDKQCNFFLSKVLEEYHSSLKDTEPGKSYTEEISHHYNILLCVVSQLIGKQFRNFRMSISRNVDTFKMEHINQIDNLPSAEQLVTMLFPQCMRIFMVAWMGTNDIIDESTPPRKRRKLQDKTQDTDLQPPNVFPFIQLILEFANNVLISGVAHVLYSRLLHSS